MATCKIKLFTCNRQKCKENIDTDDFMTELLQWTTFRANHSNWQNCEYILKICKIEKEEQRKSKFLIFFVELASKPHNGVSKHSK